MPTRQEHRNRYGLIASLIWKVPATKLLEFVGVWPRVWSRRINRRMSKFGRYRPDRNDVLVCSYFKSGTNWLLQVTLQVIHRAEVDFAHIRDIVPWPESGQYCVAASDDSLRLRSPSGLRVIKTHLPFTRVPYSQDARYVALVRDPRDVFVSSYYFAMNCMLGPLMPSVESWLKMFLSDDAICGSWAIHVDSYWRARNLPNVLFLTYEDMKRDLRGTVGALSRFLSIDLTDEQISEVLEKSSFPYMKSIDEKFEVTGGHPWFEKRPNSLFRRGESGSAAELINSAEQQQILAHFRDRLLDISSDFPIDRYFS